MKDDDNHKSRAHTSIHVDPQTGHTHVFRTDNSADALRIELAKVIGDYELEGRVEYEVQALEGPWLRLELKYVGEWDFDDFQGFPSDVEKAMQGLPYGYYEVRKRGQNQDGTHFWFEARHDYGPMI